MGAILLHQGQQHRRQGTGMGVEALQMARKPLTGRFQGRFGGFLPQAAEGGDQAMHASQQVQGDGNPEELTDQQPGHPFASQQIGGQGEQQEAGEGREDMAAGAHLQGIDRLQHG